MKEEFYWFVFHKQQYLLIKTDDGYAIPCSQEMPLPVEEDTIIHDVGIINGTRCRAYHVRPEYLEGKTTSDLRASYDLVPEVFYNMAGRSYELIYWDMNSRFCSACGTLMERFTAIGKKCPKCGKEMFPAISPAIIVLIHKDDSVLMVHARNFRGTFRGLVAGFVEPGESLEDCIAREVMEETGLKIKNVRYFASQPWPYPSVLMIGFNADYESGEIKLQDEELDFGRFFTIDDLPELPRKLSLARKLIDNWIRTSNTK